MGFKQWMQRTFAAQADSATSFYENTITPIAIIVKTEDELTKYVNKYELYDAMWDGDPDLAGALDDLSALVVGYYNGLYLDLGADKKASKDEKSLVERIEKLEEDFDFRDFIHAVVHGQFRYGDMFVAKGAVLTADNGETRRVPSPKFLPRAYCSIVENRTAVPLYDEKNFVQKANWLAVNRYTWSKGQFQMGPKPNWYRLQPMKKALTDVIVLPDVMHFSLMKNGILEKDQYNIWNMNCISKSPLKPLEALVKYKRHAMVMDMMWREGNVPFIHFQVNLEAYDPTRWPGATQELKIKAAEAAAKKKLEEFRDSIKGRQRDQGLITPSTTIAGHVEPKTRTYASPNEQVNQQNMSMNNRLGALARVRTKEGGSYAADLLLSSVTEPRLRIMAFKILRIVESYVREFLSKEILNNDLLRKIKIRKNLILPHERLDRASEALQMSQAEGVFLADDCRGVKGLLPLTKEQRKQVEAEMKVKAKYKQAPMQKSDKSAGDVAGDKKKGGPNADKVPKTPHSTRSDKK